MSTSRGFGDTVEKFTSATGIKTVVKAVFGENCGCDERQSSWNKKFPYKNSK
jgi:hypothetical protein